MQRNDLQINSHQRINKKKWLANDIEDAYTVYIYIYNYGQLLSFAGGRFIAPASENAKMSLTKSSRNSKQVFFQATWLVPPGQTIWNKCVFRCDFNCSLATVISVQLQSTEHWHYPRLSVQCFQRCVHVQGTLSSHPQPHPTPHRDLRSNTEQVA